MRENKQQLKIEYLPISDLKPYKNNARRHAEYDVAAIKASIEKFGFDDPIGIWGEDNVIVEGHGRLKAATEIGMESVPVIRLDHLSDEERRAYALAHNRTAELSEWNVDALDAELAGITEIDMSAFGFAEEDKHDVIEDDYEVVLPEEPKAKLGDIYKLGRHTLMCGDSTNIDELQRLVGGVLVDCVCTDPPYNMSYEGGGGEKDRKSKRIMNDHMSAIDFSVFLQKTYGSMSEVMKDGASFYVFYKELGEGVFITAIKAAGLRFKQTIIWVKNQLVLGGSNYQSMYEPCIYGCKGKRPAVWNGKRKQRSVIETVDLMTEEDMRRTIREMAEAETCDIIRENKPLKNDLHPTMKPIRLLARLLENSTNAGDTVLDMFGGSGSALIACEQLDRTCYINELDPRFVDVIIDRWEEFTGGQAVKL